MIFTAFQFEHIGSYFFKHEILLFGGLYTVDFPPVLQGRPRLWLPDCFLLYQVPSKEGLKGKQVHPMVTPRRKGLLTV